MLVLLLQHCVARTRVCVCMVVGGGERRGKGVGWAVCVCRQLFSSSYLLALDVMLEQDAAVNNLNEVKHTHTRGVTVTLRLLQPLKKAHRARGTPASHH